MNRKQRERRKKGVQESQARKTEYNKSNREDKILRDEQFALEKALRSRRDKRRRLKKIRKKRIQHLKSLLNRGFINDEEFEQGMKLIKKGGKT